MLHKHEMKTNRVDDKETRKLTGGHLHKIENKLFELKIH